MQTHSFAALRRLALSREIPLNILQVSTRDIAGGAERVAWDLFRTYREQGHGSWLAVGYKRSSDPDVFSICNDQAAASCARFWWRMHTRLQPYYGRVWGARGLCRLTHRLAEPGGVLDTFRGIEDFRYPGTWRLPYITPFAPDVIHCHNLHGKYFDLRVLPTLSRRFPLVLTLHDAWLLSGHCAHSFDCERWRTGCSKCPDLTLYPPIRRDATASNWDRKRAVFARSRLHVATPCRWLRRKVEESILAPAVADARIIPYGIDLSVFCAADKRSARMTLGIPLGSTVLLFSANGIRRNVWKDYETLRTAVTRVTARCRPENVIFIALGEDGPSEYVGAGEIRFVPYTPDATVVARYYQAADIYLHAARAETFPLAVLEALACGTAVVATAVGGIPEQIKPLSSLLPGCLAGLECSDAGQATGVLVPPGDAEAMAYAVESLMDDEVLRRCLGENAAADARRRFDLEREADDYLAWFSELLDRWETPERAITNKDTVGEPVAAT